MALARWNGVVQDAAGNAVSGASIEVRDERTGLLVPLFSDRDGTEGIGNPFVALGPDVAFHARGGSYRVMATKNGQEKLWRYVPIGTMQEYDFEGFIFDLQAGIYPASTKADLDAFVPDEFQALAGVVFNDPDPALNGYYIWDSVALQWGRKRGFPDTFARVTLSGSGAAQTGLLKAGVDPASIEVFFAKVATANTGALTLSVSGETPRPVVNLAGNPLSAGEWTGMVMFYLNEDGQYQLLLDAGAAASAAASASLADERAADAEAAAAAAIGAVSAVALTDMPSRAWAIANYHPEVAPSFLRTAGYAGAGDGGGALYKLVVSEPAHPGKLSITLDDGVSVAWYEIAEARLLPEMFGAKGDGDGAGGGTDDIGALDAMRDAGAALKLPLRLRRARTYKITRSWDLSSCPVLDGRHAIVDMSAISSGSRHGIIAQGGGLSNGPALSANGTERSYTVSTGATTSLAVGEDVLMSSEGFYPYSDYNAPKGEVKRVRSLGANSVTFTTPLNDNYLSGGGADSARIRKVAWLDGVDIKRVRIIGSGSPTSGERGLCLRFCRDIKVSDVRLDDQQQYQMEIASCLRGRIEKCDLNGVYYDGVTGNIFYGIMVMDASTDLVIAHCFGNRNRHLVVTSARTGGQGHYGEPCDITVIGCHQKDSQAGGGGRSYAFEVHGFGRNVKFIGCTADGCYSFARLENARGAQISACSVRNYDSAALVIGGSGLVNRDITVQLTVEGYTGSQTFSGASVIYFTPANSSVVYENIDIKVTATKTRNPANTHGVGVFTSAAIYRNVQISGTIDAGVDDADAACVFLPAGVGGVKVHDLTTIGYRTGVNSAGADLSVRDCNFKRLSAAVGAGFGVVASGARARIKDNEAENLAIAWRVSGSGSLVANNVAKACTTNTSDLGSGNTLRNNDAIT